jgi:hypothetical protein
VLWCGFGLCNAVDGEAKHDRLLRAALLTTAAIHALKAKAMVTDANTLLPGLLLTRMKQRLWACIDTGGAEGTFTPLKIELWKRPGAQLHNLRFAGGYAATTTVTSRLVTPPR